MPCVSKDQKTEYIEKKKNISISHGDSFSEEFQRSLGPFHGERDQCLPWSVDRDPAKMSSGLFGPTWAVLSSVALSKTTS